MLKLDKAVVLGMLLAVPGLLVAQNQLTAGGPIPFALFDRDGNGAISQQEFASVHEERRALRAELGYPMGRVSAPPFHSFDSNNDGWLSQRELLAGQHRNQLMRGGGMGPCRRVRGGPDMPAFSDFDLNRDGILEQNEFEQARAKRISERASQGYLMRNLANAPSFASIDSDGDGVVTADEFSAAQIAHRQQRFK
ncbi:MAG: EF-hand domain-containing protein [Candidatus Thiodiazotropha sp. (ex Ctena orbiculata)]|nr:EF-hand domain-containing protein [Candidatus Thiodiazotropha taylori]MBT2997849.1 EF-hand domain-containing protein [Candidatus Thiodiazotropha taylori]MBT3000382.1 EF-hand domain-containing protein [Candidatus Thiodiazotropha taylori]MBV2107227.1 EF-hand domain-containing protein [Candidatus Thiodiazotropha taylori]MBV2112216.1 EF-hand domain-containing protein [Candidatus Thiodiazotropha taylori]